MKNKRRPRALLKGRSDRVQDNKPDDVKWYPADSQFFSAVSRKLGRGTGKLGARTRPPPNFTHLIARGVTNRRKA